MRVAIDARPATQARKTGVGYYVANLLRTLPLVDPQTRYIAWCLHARRRPGKRLFPEIAAPNFSERASRFPSRLFEPLAARVGLPRVEWLVGFDVLLATNFVPPPTAARSVVLTVHDLAFRLFPRPDGRPSWPGELLGRSLERVARVIVPSASTQRDLMELYGVEETRIDVVPLGVEADAFGAIDMRDADARRKALGIEGPYLLYLGAIERRKNLPALVRAFGSLDLGERPTLVVAGGSVPWDPDEPRRLRDAVAGLPGPTRERVILTGYVSEVDRAALLVGTEAFVFPSLYEGFGLPVLEAMAAGVPVVTSNVSSLPEVAGDAAVLVDPSDEDDIARGIERLISDAAMRERLRELGRERARGFGWDRTARGTAASLHAAAGA